MVFRGVQLSAVLTSQALLRLGIGAGALSAHGKGLLVTNTTVTLDLNQACNVLASPSLQIGTHLELFLNDLHNGTDLLLERDLMRREGSKFKRSQMNRERPKPIPWIPVRPTESGLLGLRPKPST